jgi:hypothetical protein
MELGYDCFARFDTGKDIDITTKLEKLQEAHFLFSKEPVSCFESIRYTAQDFMTIFARFNQMTNTNPNFEKQAELVNLARTQLVNSVAELRAAVLKDMSFDHLKPGK